jgi:hypothetical protein
VYLRYSASSDHFCRVEVKQVTQYHVIWAELGGHSVLNVFVTYGVNNISAYFHYSANFFKYICTEAFTEVSIQSGLILTRFPASEVTSVNEKQLLGRVHLNTLHAF